MNAALARIRRIPAAVASTLVVALQLLAILPLVAPVSATAAPYVFMNVSGNGVAGNGAQSQFTSSQGNGVIDVTHFFQSPAGVGTFDNDNAAIFPSSFPTLFPGTGLVQGHLAMTVYNNFSQVIFDLTSFTGSLPDLIFGIWNTTDEIALPAYNIQLLDATSTLVAPTTMNLFGNDDNATQVAGRHRMQLNPLTGDITAPTLINASGIHTDAMFLQGIPTGTQKLIVTGRLGPLNTIGDGVGYYFVEQVPEPSTVALVGVALLLLASARRRRG
jgi:hypothetical protein